MKLFRTRLPLAAILLALPAFVPAAYAAHEPVRVVETYTYKTVGNLAIKADVYHLGKELRKRPVVVWIHGGSLIDGGRENVLKAPTPQMTDLFLAYGYAVVSIDYRLAPETKLPAMVEDIEDAIRWVRTQGPGLFGADPEHVAAAGSSAGGYLTLVAGYRVKPRLQVLVVDSGYSDISGPWALHGENQPKSGPGKYDHLSKEERWRNVSGAPVANSLERPNGNSDFNGYVRDNGTWPQTITGWDLVKDEQKFFSYWPRRNVTPDYPPVFFRHGRDDPDVPCKQAELMAAELNRQGVTNQLAIVPGARHGLQGGDPLRVAQVILDSVAFAHQYLDPVASSAAAK